MDVQKIVKEKKLRPNFKNLQQNSQFFEETVETVVVAAIRLHDRQRECHIAGRRRGAERALAHSGVVRVYCLLRHRTARLGGQAGWEQPPWRGGVDGHSLKKQSMADGAGLAPPDPLEGPRGGPAATRPVMRQFPSSPPRALCRPAGRRPCGQRPPQHRSASGGPGHGMGQANRLHAKNHSDWGEGSGSLKGTRGLVRRGCLAVMGVSSATGCSPEQNMRVLRLAARCAAAPPRRAGRGGLRGRP